jgi:hypothetical protein
MGVKGLLPHVPGGNKYHAHFLGFEWRKERIALDAAGLLHECARNHASSYRGGDYFPSLKEFQQWIFYMQSILRWNFCVVFDGQDSALKEVEHQRRRKLREEAAAAGNEKGAIRNDSLYIKLCSKICGDMDIPFIIAYEEADTQCLRVQIHGEAPTLIVTGDSDLLVYGFPRVVVVQSYRYERFRFFDMSPEVLSEASLRDGEDRYIHLMAAGYSNFGAVILQVFAACCGCDFTSDKCGLPGISYVTFFGALESLLTEIPSPASLRLVEFFAQHFVRQRPTSCNESVTTAEAYIKSIVDVYSRKGRFYDPLTFRVVRLDSVPIISQPAISERHARGELDPRTCRELKCLGCIVRWWEPYPLLIVTVTEHFGWIDWFQSPLSCRHIELAVLWMEMPRGDEYRRIVLHNLRLNFLTG